MIFSFLPLHWSVVVRGSGGHVSVQLQTDLTADAQYTFVEQMKGTLGPETGKKCLCLSVLIREMGTL